MSLEKSRADRDLLMSTVTSVVVAALGAGIVFGVLLHATGRIGSVAQLYGSSSVALGWVLHLVHSLVVGLLFAGGLAAVQGGRYESIERLNRELGTTGTTVALGVAFGVVVWLVVVAFALPIWMGLVLGLERPIPYVHLTSLVGLVLFGAVFGSLFHAVQDVMDDRLAAA